VEKFKKLFSGKKKIVTIPMFFGLLITFLPISIGLGLIWLIIKKVKNKRVRKILLIIISIFTLFFGSIWIYALSQPATPTVEKTEIEPTPTQIQEKEIENTGQNKQEVKVIGVVDGDTIKVLIGETVEKVRFIGLDTAETDEYFGGEATEETKNKLMDQTVWLEADSSQSDRDQYNRLLRYVWINEATTDFGKTLIENGFAHEYTYNNAYKYQELYKQAENEAEQSEKGLWTTESITLTPTQKPTTIPTNRPTAVPTTTTTTTTTSSENCGYPCSGPDLDCSDFSTHAEAQAFFDCCGFTDIYDPMKLDSTGVGDGIACESLP